MYKNIFYDFSLGLFNSLRLDIIITNANKNEKLKRLVLKICKYNFIMHILPFIITNIFRLFFGINHNILFDIIVYPINFFSICFHLLHYLDLVNASVQYTSKVSGETSALDTVSLAITMSIYNLMIYYTTTIIDFIIYDKFYLLAFFIKLLILTIYHSFYCFNNLWQYKKIKMRYRIDMHEKLWAYYVGFGTLSTIIYLFIDYPFIFALYNVYMAFAIILPFMILEKYPSVSQISYPSINLTIFSYMVGLVFKIPRYLIN